MVRSYFLRDLHSESPFPQRSGPFQSRVGIEGAQHLPRLRFCFALLFLTLFNSFLNQPGPELCQCLLGVKHISNTASEPLRLHQRDGNGQNHGKTAQKWGSSPTVVRHRSQPSPEHLWVLPSLLCHPLDPGRVNPTHDPKNCSPPAAAPRTPTAHPEASA